MSHQNQTLSHYDSNADTDNNTSEGSEDSPDEPTEQLIEKLTEAGITETRISTLTDRFQSVHGLIRAQRSEVTRLENIGEKTYEKIESEIDIVSDKEYNVQRTDKGDHSIVNWPIRNNKRRTIYISEYLLKQLRQHDELGHHRKMSEALLEWAKKHRESDYESTAKEHCKQVYNLTSTELNMCVLWDQDQTYETVEAAVNGVETAHKKAEAIIEFCKDTGREALVKEGEQKATEKIKEKARKRKEEQKAQRQAEQILSDPPNSINDWKHVETPAEGVYAYNGKFQDRYCVVALFDTGEFVKIRAFEHEKWDTIDWDADNIEKELDNTESHGTANFPETMNEGAQDMVEFFNRDDWFDFTPEEVPAPPEISQN